MQINTSNSAILNRDANIAEVIVIANSTGGIINQFGVNNTTFSGNVTNFPGSSIATLAGNAERVVVVDANSGNPISYYSSSPLDFSANKPTIPNVANNFSTGTYSTYVLVGTVQASNSRNSIGVENTSGSQCVIIRDDGISANHTAPNNASIFALTGTSVGSQGGSWSSTTFKGRIQVYSANSSSQIAIFTD